MQDALIRVSRFSDFRELISGANRLDTSFPEMMIDLSEIPDFIDPMAMIDILLLRDYLNSIGKKVTFCLRQGSKSQKPSLSYMERMDFFKFTPEISDEQRSSIVRWRRSREGKKDEVKRALPVQLSLFDSHPESNIYQNGVRASKQPERELPGVEDRVSRPQNIIEIRQIASEKNKEETVYAIRDQLRVLLSGHSEQKREIRDFVNAATEIMQNVIEHSGIGRGYIVAQRYIFKNERLGTEEYKTTFVVADAGIGIPESLQRYRPGSSLEALHLSIQEGVTSRDSGIIGGGTGLPTVLGIVQAWDGYLEIHSGDAWIGIGRSYNHEKEGLAEIVGTKVIVRLPF